MAEKTSCCRDALLHSEQGSLSKLALEENMLEDAKNLRMGRRFFFQQGNGPEHEARAIVEGARSKEQLYIY